MKRTIIETDLKIKDLNAASFLVASGLSVDDVERDGRTLYFVFKQREKALTLLKGFWAGSASVNAKAFSDAQRSLKDIIFSVPS